MMAVLGYQPIQPTKYGLEQLNGMSIHVDLRLMRSRPASMSVAVRRWLPTQPPQRTALCSEAASESPDLRATVSRKLQARAVLVSPCGRRPGERPCCCDRAPLARTAPDSRTAWRARPMHNGKV